MTHGTPRLRFAPSPTGPLHLGGARTALYNWAAARAMGGKFLLRIEDTDQVRSTAESLRIILEGLRWLGLDWDEGPEVGGDRGPYFQIERLAIYARYAERLLAAGAAYPCFCTNEEIEAGRQALAAAGAKTMYDRRCRELDAAGRRAKQAAGLPSSIRFRMPLEETLRLADLTKGEVEVNTRELDDWVMLRPDGVPLYNFACVVDDLEMGITHVVRGEEHLLNGFKQVLLFRALQSEPPRYAHIPLILGKDGRKLSKREAATNVLEYRDAGYPPDAVFNYIATLGWGFSGDRDVFTRDEMVARFQIAEIGKAGAKFDPDKLLAICGEYVRSTPARELVARVRPFVVKAGALPDAAFASHPDWVRNVVACQQERFRIYGELPAQIAFYLAEPLAFDEGATQNLAKEPAAKGWLLAFADLLERSAVPPSYPRDRGAADRLELPLGKDRPVAAATTPFANPPQLEQDGRALAERLGIKFGQLVHPIRAALTGTTKGAGLFEIVYLLGKERSLARLRAAAG